MVRNLRLAKRLVFWFSIVSLVAVVAALSTASVFTPAAAWTFMVLSAVRLAGDAFAMLRRKYGWFDPPMAA